jgi:branched-chain amino acid transport system permease protein
MRVPAAIRSATLWLLPLLVLSLALTAIVWVMGMLPAGMQRVATDALIKLLVVVGSYIFIGNSGVLSFGHVSFMGIGAYVAAWLVISPQTKELMLPDLPPLLMQAHYSPTSAALVAGLAASVFALLVGLPLARLSGISASIGSFAVLAVVNAVLSNWTSMTGGQGSLYGLPSYAGIWTTLPWAIAALALAWTYQQSRFGLRLRGAREDEVAAAASGVDIWRERLIAFVVSAFFCGVAGALYGYFLGVIVARAFYLQMTFITITMLVVGGLNSLTGAVVGVLTITAFGEVLRHLERGFDLGPLAIGAHPGLQELGLAALMLIILIFRPRGLTGGREIALLPSSWRRTKPKAGAAPESHR